MYKKSNVYIKQCIEMYELILIIKRKTFKYYNHFKINLHEISV